MARGWQRSHPEHEALGNEAQVRAGGSSRLGFFLLYRQTLWPTGASAWKASSRRPRLKDKVAARFR